MSESMITEEFVLPSTLVCLTGRELGRGSYGCVEEAKIGETLCAAKRIHDEFLKIGSSDDVRHLTSTFARECRLMSNLRHPHIVQFLGVCYQPGERLPLLVMERLDTSLHELLESKHNLPLVTKQSVLLDVARGLTYLHSQSPSIIHRDLTARNVLLTSALVAKISDMGVARIINVKRGHKAATMTKCPGNFVYMPPEAMEECARYCTSIDVFSFGNLALFTLTQTFPGNNLKPAAVTNLKSGKISPLSEVERRKSCFDKLDIELGTNHPFVLLTRDCLQNRPADRPSVSIVMEKLSIKLPKEEKQSIEVSSKLEIIKKVSKREREIQLLQEEHEKVIEELKIKKSKMKSLANQSISKDALLMLREQHISELQEQLRTQAIEIEVIEKKLNKIQIQVFPVNTNQKGTWMQCGIQSTHTMSATN